MTSSKLIIEKGDIDFYKQIYFDAVYRNKISNTMNTTLGEIDDGGGIIDSSAPNSSAEANLKRLLKLESCGAISDIRVHNEEDTAHYYDPEEDFEIYIDAFVAIAEFKVNIRKLKKIFQDLEFYPAYFVRQLKTREITLNNEYLLSRPNFTKANDTFFSYVYERPYQDLLFEDIRKEIEKADGKIPKSKKPSNYLTDLGFTGEIAKLFFSEVSNIKIRFRPIVMQKELPKFLINTKLLKEQLKGLVKIRVK